jgi:predicted DsbA family dithiol-disulfide isomerase
MATIIDLSEARARRDRRRGAGDHDVVFAFDLSPHAYDAAPMVAERFPGATWVPVHDGGPEGRAAARVAAAAAEHGRTREFALAALRLAYAHGKDLDDLGTLATAAGIAEIPLDTVLDAAFDPRRDAALEQAAQTSSRNTISVESERRGPSLRMRV